MLLTPKNLPMSNGGIPWGLIFVAVIFIGGAGYMTYQVMKDPVTIKKPNPVL
jgi:hypothetical protein